jgi:hypothetical protein
MSGSAQQDAQRRREAYQAALDDVRRYVPTIGHPVGFSAERVYQSALMKLQVDCSDLRYTIDVDGPFKARFQAWKAARTAAAQDAEVQAGVRDLAEWQTIYDLITERTGEAPSCDEDGAIPTVADMCKEALDRLGVPYEDDVDPESFKFILQAALLAGAGSGGATRQAGQMGADSAAVASFESRFPNIPRPHRIF